MNIEDSTSTHDEFADVSPHEHRVERCSGHILMLLVASNSKVGHMLFPGCFFRPPSMKQHSLEKRVEGAMQYTALYTAQLVSLVILAYLSAEC